MTVGEVGIRETQFHARIDDLVAIALASGSSTFEGLLRSLPGVWPVDALAALKRLEGAGRLLASIAVQLAQEAGNATYPVPAYSDLPVPHPLDFEWRFTSSTSRILLSIADDLAPKSYGLLLYGTPGVASHAISHSLQRTITFVAEDNPVTRRLAEANTLHRAPISIELCQRAKYFEEAGGVIQQLEEALLRFEGRGKFEEHRVRSKRNAELLKTLPKRRVHKRSHSRQDERQLDLF